MLDSRYYIINDDYILICLKINNSFNNATLNKCWIRSLTFFLHFFTREVDWFSLTGVILLLCFAPFIVFFFIMACDQYQCSVSLVLLDIYNGDASPLSILKKAPSVTWTASKIYAAWVTFQVKIFTWQQ